MPDSIQQDYIALVETQMLHFDKPLEIDCGTVLSESASASETYVERTEAGSNLVLSSHALSWFRASTC